MLCAGEEAIVDEDETLNTLLPALEVAALVLNDAKEAFECAKSKSSSIKSIVSGSGDAAGEVERCSPEEEEDVKRALPEKLASGSCVLPSKGEDAWGAASGFQAFSPARVVRRI